MPHLIVEFAQDLASDQQVETMLDAVHEAAAATELFVESHIKVRAVPVRFYRTGGENDAFIHAQLRIKQGRNDGQKKVLSGAVLEALKSQDWGAKVITVEVVDMDSATYTKALC